MYNATKILIIKTDKVCNGQDHQLVFIDGNLNIN